MQLAELLGDGSFGGGFGAGIGAGMAIGIGVGMSSGSSGVKKKHEDQLAAAIDSGEIAVFDKEGNSMTIESVLELLENQANKK